MSTLDSLKLALRQKAISLPRQPLSDPQYSVGFDIFMQVSGWMTYQNFIIPQLSELFTSLFNSRPGISVLEIGPGPKSILGYLSSHLKRKIKRYAAFEPNALFASKLEEWCCSTRKTESSLPCLESPPRIYRTSFGMKPITRYNSGVSIGDDNEKFDVILFCHSMYGMKPKHAFIERALELLAERPEGGMVIVFHRDGSLHFDELVCHRTASFPTGLVRVPNEDETLDGFAPFMAGFVVQGLDLDKAIRLEWREVCRALGRREEAHPGHLLFSSPNIMVAFTQHATKLPELMAQVPFVKGDRAVKNSEARRHLPASIVRPTEIRQVQQCVRWALKYGLSLTIFGGGHSGHCLWNNIVSVDMSAFNQVHILTIAEAEGEPDLDTGPLVVAEAGCKMGDIIRKTMAVGMTVPLGSRPSVGAGLWLQGGIGHLARRYGLACDAIVGAVLVSVDSGQVFCIGCVPRRYQPINAVRPENESALLWAMKGAGTNFGIVISVIFKLSTAPTYLTRDWIVPLANNLEARRKLSEFDELVAKRLTVNSSADVYLYWATEQLHLGVTLFESSTNGFTSEMLDPTAPHAGTVLGPENNSGVVDGVELFEKELYISDMHGGHVGGKTSSFKRCLFLKSIGAVNIVDTLVAAIRTCPSPLCYVHLLQGGAAVADVSANATAFGCRDWDFACVVTGVWERDLDGSYAAQAAVQWVYSVVRNLLPFSKGIYGADLGPDPRDAILAAKAFGPNLSRLARLKHSSDPRDVLAYACPLPKAPIEQKLIILVTGESCAGKDYCADIWVTAFNKNLLTARVVSISDAIKREYSATTGADLDRLLGDRAYKEQQRPALTTFYQHQVQQRPWFPEEQFLHVVHGIPNVDVLLITGMRDEAPVAAFSHLVPYSRLLELRVNASEKTRRARQGWHGGVHEVDHNRNPKDDDDGRWKVMAVDYRPNLIFNNDTTGNEVAEQFAKTHLLPFFQEDLQRLGDMVRSIPDFPRLGVEFRHVLDISQRPGGLTLCTSLLRTYFVGDWSKVDVVACCETGGFVYGSALAALVDLPLALIREAGKLPPPTVSVMKFPSYISSLASDHSKEKRIEMGRDIIPQSGSIVVVDDVLATGETLCAMLQLFEEADIPAENVSIMVVAEFPVHRGRELLRQRGFGRVHIQSLLIFGCA